MVPSCLRPVRWHRILLCCLVPALLSGMVSCTQAQNSPPWSALISPDNSLQFLLLKAGHPAATLGLGGWGPNWAWVGLDSKDKATGDRLDLQVPFVVNKDADQVVAIRFQAWQSGPKSVAFRYDLNAGKDVPLTMLMAGLSLQGDIKNSKLVMTSTSGAQETVTLPTGVRGASAPIARAALTIAGSEIGIAFDPPLSISFDHDARIMLAHDLLPAGTHTQTLTFTFPDAVAFQAKQADLERYTRPIAGPDWFAFTPTNSLAPSVIGMENWLEKPAGKHGGVRTVGDHFQFADGTPVKFWGVDLSYGGGCAPAKADADFTAARFARFGVNGVRLHKFTYPKDDSGIGDVNDPTHMDPEGLDRLDYFAAQLKKRGVYFGWSHTYGFHVRPGNRAGLVAYDEIDKNLHGNTYALVNFAEDVQDLLIDTVVNLLKHKNPYTGLTYAEEPALSYIELQNEDDIFFYTSEGALNACPTYKARFVQRCSDWLKARYGTQEALQRAWQGALGGGETLAARNIAVQVNPWFYSDAHLPGLKGGERQRLLDNAQFLHEVQNKFYLRFVEAIRRTGYKGPICGSPWQAPSMLPHYYNLRSDWLAGYVDRHNYFGGGLFDTMLTQPGSGYFSTGLQQVADRPFGMSEWIHVYPSLYSAEGPVLMAAYAMGLQGWDASYEFQSSSSARMFDDTVGWFPWGVWEADTPTQLGQYPLLSRMLLRGDVKEGAIISTRRVSLPELEKGEFNFTDKVEQSGDVKSFSGAAPPEALAAGRMVVEFTPKPTPSTLPDLERYRKGTSIVSNTGQLVWDTAGKGYFTINTPGTRGVVGFAQGKALKLGSVEITSATEYASILVTAAGKDETLANAKTALISAMARACNSGFTYFTVDDRVRENGKGPILLEPVKATIRFLGRKIATVHVLDHDGRRTTTTLPVGGNGFTLDSAKDRAIYYEVTFAN